MKFFDRTRAFAPAVLRIGLSLVFIWFGTQQLMSTPVWEQLIPPSVISMTAMSAATLVTFNGAFEVVFGLCLLFGFFTEVSALLLALHMLSITFTVGYNAIGVRDFGLSMSAISLFLLGPHRFSLDHWLFTRNTQKEMQV